MKPATEGRGVPYKTEVNTVRGSTYRHTNQQHARHSQPYSRKEYKTVIVIHSSTTVAIVNLVIMIFCQYLVSCSIYILTLVVIVPSPSLSKSSKASLNSATCSSVKSSADVFSIEIDFESTGKIISVKKISIGGGKTSHQLIF